MNDLRLWIFNIKLSWLWQVRKFWWHLSRYNTPLVSGTSETVNCARIGPCRPGQTQAPGYSWYWTLNKWFMQVNSAESLAPNYQMSQSLLLPPELNTAGLQLKLTKPSSAPMEPRSLLLPSLCAKPLPARGSVIYIGFLATVTAT